MKTKQGCVGITFVMNIVFETGMLQLILNLKIALLCLLSPNHKMHTLSLQNKEYKKSTKYENQPQRF